MYLCGSGIGTIGVMDGDTVESSNLHRQVIHDTSKLGLPKVDSAKQFLQKYNPYVNIETFPTRITPQNARSIIKNFDLV
jgi:adenylyltransferase/sulfurtransferase